MNKTLISLFGIALISGCTTFEPQSTSNAPSKTNAQLMRQREDLRQVSEQNQRLNAQIENLEASIESINQQLHHTQGSLNTSIAAQNEAIRTLEKRQTQDKSDIISSLSKEIENVVANALRSVPTTSTSSSKSAARGNGWEHVVERGQTLSAIAKAYGVSTRVIIQSNKIKNPNNLRIGQKLFIPE